ncbi:MAG: ADP-ribosylglycohydrolase family protein [Deltaproteobacteria bacterium]|jgi:type I restriction enzyme M protein|nr:ADP-ribosylglycohydrolase family protein [Deltaproteobacteria bacterium]
MLGAIIGDIVGSRFEFHNHRSLEFDFFHKKCKPTDDSVMTVAVAKSLLEAKGDWSQLESLAIKNARLYGLRHFDSGYGQRFKAWLTSPDPKPYNSYGNGAAMRVSPCALAAKDLAEAQLLSRLVTQITHNHPEGLKGAEATVTGIFWARQGWSLERIRALVEELYYPLDFTLDEIRPTYRFNVTCQGTLPPALLAFLTSESFEDAVRKAISVGGDSDTLAAITGSLAEAYWGIDEPTRATALNYLSPDLREVVLEFESCFPLEIPTIKIDSPS